MNRPKTWSVLRQVLVVRTAVYRALFSWWVLAACSSAPKDITSSGCESCHRPATENDGLEQQHALFALRCVECHGGNPEERSVAAAHVAGPVAGQALRAMSRDELAATDVAFRRFINPGDSAASAMTCGTVGRTGSEGCHQAIVEASAVSVHMTGVGIASQARFNSSLSDSRSALGLVTAIDANFMPGRASPGTLGRVDAISITDLPASSATVPQLYSYALAKGCSGCHLGLYGAAGDGRPNADFAGGCSACHMFYEDDAKSISKDPSRNTQNGVHPLQHTITRTVPDRQCIRCHSRSLRIGTQWMGWREKTIAEDDVVLRSALRVSEPKFGRPSGYFIADEEVQDSIDYTPPDVHMRRGMSCVDCHLAPDGHGNGKMQSDMAKEVSVECEDCHGTFDSSAGVGNDFRTSGGTPLTRMRRKENGDVVLTGALDGKEHPVTQIVGLPPSREQTEAHKTTSHGALECYACHTAWMQNVYSLRRTLDYRASSTNPVNGKNEMGTVTDYNEIQLLGPVGASRDDFAFTGYHLGMNSDGKISPMMVENARFDVIVPCNPNNEPVGTCVQSEGQLIFGKKVVDGFVPKSPDGKRGFQWTPVFPHTTATRDAVQTCGQCHPRDFEANDDQRVKATYGYGSGRFLASDGASIIDLTQMIDTNGNAVVSLPVPNSAPVPLEKITRALNYRIVPPLR